MCPNSWEPRNTTISHCTTNLTFKIHLRENPGAWLPLLRWDTVSKELSRRQHLCKVSWEGRWNFSGWFGIGGIMWPDLGANSGIGESDLTTLPPEDWAVRTNREVWGLGLATCIPWGLTKFIKHAKFTKGAPDRVGMRRQHLTQSLGC